MNNNNNNDLDFGQTSPKGKGSPNRKGTEKKAREKHETLKVKRRAQKFRKNWLMLADYKSWLTPVPTNPFRAQCTICNVEFIAELTVIRNHAKRKSHISMMKNLSKHQESIQCFVDRVAKSKKISEKTKIAEIKLCAFLAEHNIAIRTIDHLTELLKKLFPDSGVAQGIQLKRTKSTNIIKNIIGATEKEILTKKLKSTPFSVLVDESTDISAIKTACIIVRFYDEDAGSILCCFWELTQLFKNAEEAATGATAERLFNAIEKCNLRVFY